MIAHILQIMMAFLFRHLASFKREGKHQRNMWGSLAEDISTVARSGSQRQMMCLNIVRSTTWFKVQDPISPRRPMGGWRSIILA